MDGNKGLGPVRQRFAAIDAITTPVLHRVK